MEGIAGLPVDKAANALLAHDPVLGAVIVFQMVAIVFLIGWVIKLLKDGKADSAAKDRKLEEANAKLVETLREVIPAIKDMKDMATDMAIHARGRTR